MNKSSKTPPKVFYQSLLIQKLQYISAFKLLEALTIISFFYE